jgi:hypothetical protein
MFNYFDEHCYLSRPIVLYYLATNKMPLLIPIVPWLYEYSIFLFIIISERNRPWLQLKEEHTQGLQVKKLKILHIHLEIQIYLPPEDIQWHPRLPSDGNGILQIMFIQNILSSSSQLRWDPFPGLLTASEFHRIAFTFSMPEQEAWFPSYRSIFLYTNMVFRR